MSVQDSYIASKCDEITALLREAKRWAEGDAKLGAHLATYANVLLLGMLEDSIEYLVGQRAKKSGDTEVEHYVTQAMSESFRNPSYNKICDMLGKFSSQYKERFKSKIAHDSSEVDALNSVVENKTNLAHVGLANLNLSIDDASNYYVRVVPILEALEDVLVTNP